MEKPDLFRTGVLVWLFLLSVGDVWQFNAINKLSLLQTQTLSDSSYKHQGEYQYEDVDLYSEIYVVDISHDDEEKKFHVKRHKIDVESEAEAEAEAEPHTADPEVEDIMTFRQNKRTLRSNQNVRESMNLNRHSMHKSKRRLATNFTGDTDGTVTKQRIIDSQTTSSNQISDTFDTNCVLVNEPCLDFYSDCENWSLEGFCTNIKWQDWMEFYCQKSCNVCPSLPSIDSIFYNSNYNNRSIASFSLDFQIRTDKWPEDTSWSLSPQHENSNMVIDSLNKNFKNSILLRYTLHTFEYHCVIVSEKELQKKDMIEPICYDFYLHDSERDGICCRYGRGYYELNINNSTNPLISERFYEGKLETSTSFCIDNNGSLVDNRQLYDENESKHSNRYPSRECINDTCVCDSNPALFISNDDKMHGIKMNVIFQMMSLSGSEKLMDINTPQYKAACWILKDDPYFIQHNINNMISTERIEERMIQRYILAVFYFATTGENWTYDLYFLSDRSECEWNSMDDFYDYEYDVILGSVCHEDENVMSVVLKFVNLDGTIIEELYGLKKLEQLYLYPNENLRGSIPSSLGRLSELRQLVLFDNSLEGSIPPELFHATKMQHLDLGQNNLSSSIPENIGNLKKLIDLSLRENQLTGSIPDSMYSLTSLIYLALGDNGLSSSISPSISNLKRMKRLQLSQNNLTGEIPSSIKHLSGLEDVTLNDNELSGEIPNGIESLSNIFVVSLHNNRLNGSVSNELCEKDFYITADCRNDVSTPDVSCSCCRFCTDQTPQRNGECADTTLRIEFDHIKRNFFDLNSDELEWSLIDRSTSQVILYDGPYFKLAYNNTQPSYKACAANTGCYSLIMKSAPIQNTNYTIFWNDELIHSGTFLGFEENDGVYKNDNKTMVIFQYDHEVEEFIFNDTTCNNVQLTCSDNDDVYFIEKNTKQRLLYSTAVKISGMSQIQNISSIQSKALCWILKDSNNIYNNTNNDILQTRFTQRYVLTIIHLMSFKGLFGPDEYPPLLDECDWEGIQCKDNNINIVTTISLSSSKGQIIDGPLIDEIGSLAFVEVLRLSQTELTGSIPLLLSNMWSLTELDLSSNSLYSSIPDSFFNELKHLKYLNLSNNTITSSIPSNIGAYSEISTLILSGNQLTGSFPLGNFKWHSLEHLDISENELDSIDLSLLLNHSKFKTINLAANFFVGELQEDIFMVLSQLHYFNISQNEVGGVIPFHFPDKSNMTHLDIHYNRFSGTVPLLLSDLRHLHHLNLQGNRLTGSIPSQLNKLKSLKLMALSNNELKGSISIDFDSLPDLDSLYLHNNKLSGEAPVVKTKDKKMKAYTSDCGFPSDSLEPVSCSSCDICCNSDNECQKKPNEIIRPTSLTIIFIFSVIALIVLLYIMKDHITSSQLLQSYFSGTVWNWNALMLISDKSVYQFMLTRNKVGWMIAFGCSIFQLMTLFLFVIAADIKSESGDLVYTLTCPSNSLECDNVKTVTSYGIMIFSFITAVWLLRDIVSSVKLMLLSFETRNIDFLFTSSVIFLVTVLSAWTSIYYNMALGTKNTELIVNAVILLFVIEIDERLYQLAKSCNPMWVAEIEANAREGVYITGDDLLLSHSIQEISKGFGKYRSKLSERIRSSMNQ